ncbi:MAG: hypothetical protein PHQ04_03420 [Opitutaceae bacterium]|nr:hypothetical protein [Opitutaceae bacterium]
MDSGVIERLEALRPEIKAKWETLLRVEPVSSPLASPDALVHLIDWTLDTLFHALRAHQTRRHPLRNEPAEGVTDFSALCSCGMNPLLAYFVAGEQALLENLVLVQVRDGHSTCERTKTASELKHTLSQVARREIEAFCAVCQHREHQHHRTPAHPVPVLRR